MTAPLGTEQNSFAVGEIAEGVGFIHASNRNGMECIILSPLLWKDEVIGKVTRTKRCGYYHRVQWADGVVSVQQTHNLRKKRPPVNWSQLCKLDELPREVTHV